MNLLQEITLLRATRGDVSSRLGVRAMTLLIAFMILGLFQSVTYTGAVAVAAGSLPADFADTGGKLPATIGGGQWDDIFAEAGANGPVKALVTAPDGTLYVGGQFTTIAGQTVNRIAAWDGNRWHTLGSGFNNIVNALAVAPNGDLYAGGAFTQAGGVTVNRVARWDGNQWQALGSGFNNTVFALTVAANGDLFAGGLFTATADGVPHNYIARWNGTTWRQVGTGTNGYVYALAAAPDGVVYIGGAFTQADSLPIHHIGRYSSTGGWNVVGTGVNDNVLALAIGQDGTLYAGGDFTEINAAYAYHVARWDGNDWASPGGGLLGGRVSALAINPATGQLYAGGSFGLTGGGVFVGRVARWTGSSWVGPYNNAITDSGPNDSVFALAFQPGLSGRLFVGGRFTQANGRTVNRLAVLEVTGSTGWYSIGQAVNDTVYTLALAPSGDLYAGGKFTQAGGATVNYVAVWKGHSWYPIKNGHYGPVSGLAVGPDGALYAGVTKQSAPFYGYISRWDGSQWKTLGNTFTFTSVSALAVAPDGTLYAGVYKRNGNPEFDVVRWDGSEWQSLGGTSDEVDALAVAPDGTLYAGGWFFQAGGVPASGVARWDGSGWHALGDGLSPPVYDLIVASNGDLYAGGSGGPGGVTVSRWDGSQWHALGGGFNNGVYALALDTNGNLFAGGLFTEAGGKAAKGVVLWDGSEWFDLGAGIEYSPGSTGVFALAAGPLPQSAGDALYVGGKFVQAGGRQAINMARWRYTAASPPSAPVAVDNAYTTLLNTALTVAAPGVLGNDSTGQGGALTAILTTSPSNGALTLNQNGSFTYIPNAGFIGEDSFTYTAVEGSVSSNEAIVGIKVEALPQGPAGHTVFLPLVLK